MDGYIFSQPTLSSSNVEYKDKFPVATINVENDLVQLYLVAFIYCAENENKSAMS